jgi:NADH-quinone oxidoreductase subunit G
LSEARPLIELTIDGKRAAVPEGTNILEAAKTVGVRIPNFCYHPDLSWEGSCRMCLVTIEGRPKLTASCCERVAPGMVVHVASEEAERARRAQLEFLLLNHPLDCPICDQAGECKLQDYYVEHGRYHSRMPRGLKLHKKKVVDLGERIMLDKERCVLCSRCVRFCREVSGSHALQFFARGVVTELGTENDQPITGDDYIGNVVDICPVGALTSKDFRFRQRVWFLRSTESVCAHCSTGCNIRVDERDGVLYRFVPRRNPEVNRSWICDAGRDSYKLLQGPARLTEPRLRRAGRLVPATWEEALATAQAAVDLARSSRAAAALASPRAATETLYLFKRFAREVLGTERLDYRADGSHERTARRVDAVLRRADPHPNNTACRLLELAGTPSSNAVLEACEAGEVKVLYLLGTEFLTGHPDLQRVQKALAKVELVVAHAVHDTPELAMASVVLPDAVHTEYDGTFVNYQGRVQRFRRASAPAGQARPAARVLVELAARAGVTLPAAAAETVFAELCEKEPAFAGLDWKGLGLEGALAGGREPVPAR